MTGGGLLIWLIVEIAIVGYTIGAGLRWFGARPAGGHHETWKAVR